MSAFAKLFERDGKQVLVTKGETDDGEPALCFRFTTNVAEHSVEVKINFSSDNEELDEWEVLDRAFDGCGEDRAFEVRDGSPAINL